MSISVQYVCIKSADNATMSWYGCVGIGLIYKYPWQIFPGLVCTCMESNMTTVLYYT